MPIYEGKNSLQYSLGRLKNLIRQAEELLGANRRNPTTALKILQPALALLNDLQFWQRREQGLAIFLVDETIYAYHLPLMLEELVVVDNQFYIKPLLPLMSRAANFRKVRKQSATV